MNNGSMTLDADQVKDTLSTKEGRKKADDAKSTILSRLTEAVTDDSSKACAVGVLGGAVVCQIMYATAAATNVAGWLYLFQVLFMAVWVAAEMAVILGVCMFCMNLIMSLFLDTSKRF